MAPEATDARVARLEEWRDMLKPHCDDHERKMTEVVLPACAIVNGWNNKLDRIWVALIIAGILALGGLLMQYLQIEANTRLMTQIEHSQMNTQNYAENGPPFHLRSQPPKEGNDPSPPAGVDMEAGP